ncbi:hypothetical protein NY035_05625 [Corynebacterium diphtheriae bv. mitis]|uniref:hypothetical protein n=1 Tax=Corynebacterium diphtheriae TaxID=1717 RepID=UPI000245B733|nr:hypothetical protein [Corynebacterium diphtheriae]AEX45319.1 hypothetical protein CDB402_0007 [Corynebacterium diphtheriae INCA 402]AEX68689.1 hypothetical protein CDPW8_0007 [Corynebacterium diphtheriae PW8]AEX75508.1 hypothetical protein CDHC02_0007 [Corynebacterium diphtheriae HC02]AEX77738.1 hypothetical protein CDHC03_0007 [Corynebacterium diphtheriae HC03]AEX80000.1 hypothetical protein CDHC04_0007 [Corynebacterium diphtheriae HC04]
MRGLTPEQTLMLADAFCAHASGDLSVRDYAALNAIAAVTTAHIHAVVVFPTAHHMVKYVRSLVIQLSPLDDRNTDFADFLVAVLRDLNGL